MGGQPLFAKHSLLGVSLVSVMRGSCGSWAKVQAEQSRELLATAAACRARGSLMLQRR
ncbi:hypothetical protein [Streptomyces sp. NPDC050485]|uniref:hypothetical protein n=1 Tax=Streptomyces sp. NPDC050485 TaxID=3365617 RepID=UPI0037BAC3D6